MASSNKYRASWQAFNSNWFKQNQSSLLSWLNGSWLKRKLSRHALRIKATELVTEIGPSYYIVKLDETERRADFRTHPKYAKRLYYSLIAYWWFLHFLDWAFLDRFVPQYSFGFTDLVAYPAAGDASTTGDGYTARVYTTGQALATFLAAAGTSMVMTTTAGTLIQLQCHATTTNFYIRVRRAGFSFDTAAIGANSIISSAVFSIEHYSNYSADTFGSGAVDKSLNIVSFSPVNPGSFATTDHVLFGSTIYATMSYDDFISSEAYKSFTLSSEGRTALINKTGISILGVRFGSDISGTGVTWSAEAVVAVGIRWADSASESDPKLEVTYTEGSPSVYRPSAIVVG